MAQARAQAAADAMLDDIFVRMKGADQAPQGFPQHARRHSITAGELGAPWEETAANSGAPCRPSWRTSIANPSRDTIWRSCSRHWGAHWGADMPRDTWAVQMLTAEVTVDVGMIQNALRKLRGRQRARPRQSHVQDFRRHAGRHLRGSGAGPTAKRTWGPRRRQRGVGPRIGDLRTRTSSPTTIVQWLAVAVTNHLKNLHMLAKAAVASDGCLPPYPSSARVNKRTTCCTLSTVPPRRREREDMSIGKTDIH